MVRQSNCRSDDGKTSSGWQYSGLGKVTYENPIGSVMLQGMLLDSDFQKTQNAVYYARVLEIPTPRWSTFDAKELGVEVPEYLHKTIQERAYTSPIFYDHH